MVYENIFIANYILHLGIKLQELKQINESSIDLFQQTPADPTLGDLFSKVNGKCYLIEFKREDGTFSKEKEKLKKIDSLNDECKNISESCHFLAICKQKDKEAKILLTRYLNFTQADNDEIPHDEFIKNQILGKNPFTNINKTHHKEEYISSSGSSTEELLNDMKKIINEALKINYIFGVTNDEFIKYLSCLKSIFNTGKSYSTACLVVNINEVGEISLAPFDSIEQLLSIDLDKSLKNIEMNIFDDNLGQNDDLDQNNGNSLSMS